MLDYTFTNQFKKSIKLMEKRRYKTDEIYEIITMIIWQEPLPERCREHGLSGDYEGFTECHALNNVLLVYILAKEKVTFVNIGTHSDLF